jgi:hypothetical protein
MEHLGEKINACRLLMKKPEGKRLPWKPRRRWVGNNRICVKKRDVGVAWAYVAKDKYKWRTFVKTAMKPGVIYWLCNCYRVRGSSPRSELAKSAWFMPLDSAYLLCKRPPIKKKISSIDASCKLRDVSSIHEYFNRYNVLAFWSTLNLQVIAVWLG